MLRFGANISTMFTELKPLERFAAAAKAGFAAVEMQTTPFELDLDDLVRARDGAGLPFLLLNAPMGNREKGDRGLAALPDRVDELTPGLELAHRYAGRLGIKFVTLHPGCPGPTVEPARARATLVENFRRAARLVRDIGATVLLEPMNTQDVPGTFVSRPADAISILDEVGEPNVGLQFDFYHMAVVGEPLLPAFEHYLPRIAHIQFSDAPGRQEPGTGTIDFNSVFDAVSRSSYGGWTCAEYFPKRPTADTLAWFAPYRRR
jgi:hydroxypyruvate isomerase